MDGDFSLEGHVEAIASRTQVESERLARVLVGSAWPGGHGDRSERGALEWVKRWRPGSGHLEPLVCGCARGRCAVCN